MLNPTADRAEDSAVEAAAPPTVYRCAPGVRWAVETRGLTLYHSDRGAFCCIPYPFAAVWDLLQRGYRLDDAAQLTGCIAGVSTPAARGMILKAVRGWGELGLLRKEDGDGESLADLNL